MAVKIWAIDPMHSEVQFKIKHLVVSTITGSFKKFQGTVTTNKEDFTDAEINLNLDVKSIDTNQSDRDEHLQKADFFDSETYPEIKFQSTSFTKKLVTIMA
ncbi:polyisoprenoid-binding protein YceI [Pedobacter sp. UYP30]|uniref:YceI family protein n=1 Tax=Pedobacter sp. UYP30 TaxID=1756400 RepID=UPI00339A0B9D